MKYVEKLYTPFIGRNQAHNTQNPCQGDKKRVLAVCSAGLLRSPTIAKVLSEKYNRNTRACGTSQDYALVPISEALLVWAEEIHVVKEQEGLVKTILNHLELNTPVYVLDIPDRYNAFSPELLEIVEAHYDNIDYEV